MTKRMLHLVDVAMGVLFIRFKWSRNTWNGVAYIHIFFVVKNGFLTNCLLHEITI